MASPNLSEIVSTTLKRRTRKLADNVTEHNALLRRMPKRTVPGGESIVKELAYAENGTFKWYSGYEALDITPQDVISAAEFDWKQAAVSVTISGIEQLKNAGPDRMIPLLESRIMVAEKTMLNNMSVGLVSDGTADGGKQIGGLALLVADDPTTGTVGGINRATWSFWRNQEVDASGTPATATNIQGYMADLYIECVRGSDKPNFAVASTDYFRFFWDSLVAIQRINSPEKGSSGFRELSFMGPGGEVGVIYDGNISANHLYMLNTDYLFYQPHSQCDMVAVDRQRSINQDAIVQHILWAGNMTMSNSSLQGVLHE